MTKEFAQKIYEYLKEKNMGFCFTAHYGLISREYLEENFNLKF